MIGKDIIEEEKILKICSLIFSPSVYNEFLTVVEDKKEEISSISLAPITNYSNNGNCIYGNRELLCPLYQHIKYFLEQENMYSPKLQEGMAICASKAIMICVANSNCITGYIDVGDRSISNDKINPFEEISRMLLISNISNYYESYSRDINISLEARKFLNSIKCSFDKEGYRKSFGFVNNERVLDLIEEELEQSNIDSNNPLTALSRENGKVLDKQFERIEEAYSNKIDFQTLIGEIPSGDFKIGLLKKFHNKLVKSKRNIGVYQVTKCLTKQN